ncbi:hypothetical protein V6N13_074049 [Hibiscus sabdariffa]
MFDPLENELSTTVYGVRSMLAVKYISEIQKKYPSESLGWSFCSELKRIIRCSDYVKATRRLEEFVRDKESKKDSDLHARVLCSGCQCSCHLSTTRSSSMLEKSSEESETLWF